MYLLSKYYKAVKIAVSLILINKLLVKSIVGSIIERDLISCKAINY